MALPSAYWQASSFRPRDSAAVPTAAALVLVGAAAAGALAFGEPALAQAVKDSEAVLADFDVSTAPLTSSPRQPATAQGAACLSSTTNNNVLVAPELLHGHAQVSFLGQKIDHKVIVEWVVLGQTFGFIGSLVGGWVAADRKEEVERLNARLLAVNKQANC